MVLVLAMGQALAQSSVPQTAAPQTAVSPASAPQTIVIEGRNSTEMEQRRQAIAGVTVVGRDQLDQYGDGSVLDVLQRVPGVSVEDDVPRLRGMGEGYTVILLNGDPAPPGFSMDTLAPADIERIEVTKGPTAEHGGAAGIINIILRVAPRLQQRELRVSVGYRDVRPQGNASLSWGDRLGQGEQTLGFHLPLSVYTWANGGDLDLSRFSRNRNMELVDQQISGGDQWLGQGVRFSPRLDWKRNATDSLHLQLIAQINRTDNRAWRETQVLQGPPVVGVADQTHSQGDWRLLRANTSWKRRWIGGQGLELKGGATASRSLSEGHSRLFDAAMLPTTARQSFTSNRDRSTTQGARLTLPQGEMHRWVLGWDLEQRHRRELRRWLDNGVERIGGSLGVPFAASLQRTQLFAQDEWTPGHGFSALLGLRLDALRTRSADATQDFLNTSTTLSPVVNLRYALDGAAGKQLLRWGLSRSQRLPDLSLLMPRYNLNGTYQREISNTALAADSAGNPQLRPERADGMDLALEHHLAGGGVISASLFHRRVDGLIRRRIALETNADASVPVGVQRWVSRPSNFGRAHSSGLELEAKGGARQLLPVAWALPTAWQLRAALSIYRSRVEQLDDPEARLEGQPPWQTTLGMDRPPDSRSAQNPGFGASFRFVPAFATRQTDLQRVWRGSVRQLDAYAVWRFDRQTQLRLSAKNLLRTDRLSRSQVEDLDGFVAESSMRRTTAAEVTAQFTLRF